MYITSEHTVEEVSQWIKDNATTDYALFHGVHIHISLRMIVLTQSQVCVSCGCVGSLWRLECSDFQGKPHLNLYTREKKTKKGELVIMTKDHIFPQFLGGKNVLTNLQTMCDPCNVLKGHKIL